MTLQHYGYININYKVVSTSYLFDKKYKYSNKSLILFHTQRFNIFCLGIRIICSYI